MKDDDPIRKKIAMVIEVLKRDPTKKLKMLLTFSVLTIFVT